MKGDIDMSNTKHVAKAEATGTDIEIDFEGHTYTIPPSVEWPLDAIEAAEDGEIVRSTKLILGVEQWAEFRERHSKFGDLMEFMKAVEKVAGGNR